MLGSWSLPERGDVLILDGGELKRWRRHDQHRRGLGIDRDGGYTRLSSTGKGGFSRGSHGEVIGDPSVLGDGLVTTNRSMAAVGSEDKDGIDESPPGRPASCGSEGRTKTTFRSSGLCRRGSGMAVAVVAASAAVMAFGGCVRERQRRGEEAEGE